MKKQMSIACSPMSEYETTPHKYNESRGENLYEVVVSSKKYKITVDESGNPKVLSRYNEQYKMFVNLSFTETEDKAIHEEVSKLLKSMAASRRMGLTPGKDSGTIAHQDNKIKENL